MLIRFHTPWHFFLSVQQMEPVLLSFETSQVQDISGQVRVVCTNVGSLKQQVTQDRITMRNICDGVVGARSALKLRAYLHKIFLHHFVLLNNKGPIYAALIEACALQCEVVIDPIVLANESRSILQQQQQYQHCQSEYYIILTMFSQVERILHDTTFNPPVGYYELISQNQPNRALDFSKSLQREKPLKQGPQEPVLKHNSQFTRQSIASPQLSAYAKPSQRLRLERIYRRERKRTEMPKFEIPISVAVVEKPLTPTKGKLMRKMQSKRHSEEVESDASEQLNPQTQEALQNSTIVRCKTQVRRQRRCRFKNIFQLYPSDSLELAQQREKMREKPVPPPGYYYNERSFSSIRQNYTPRRLQCFQSTVRRFSDNQAEVVAPPVGSYNISPLPNKAVGVIPIEKQLRRKEKVIKTPGVGSYNLENQGRFRSFSQNTDFPCPFGSSSRRF